MDTLEYLGVIVGTGPANLWVFLVAVVFPLGQISILSKIANFFSGNGEVQKSWKMEVWLRGGTTATRKTHR